MTSAPPRRRSLLRIVVVSVSIAAAFGLIATLALLLLRPAGGGIDGALAHGEPAETPGFDLEVLNQGTLRPELASLARGFSDGRLTNADLAGTPVVLNMWASWCVPCREEAPIFKKVSEGASAEGVLFLGLNSLDGRTAAMRFVREFKLTYPNIREYENTVTRSFGANAFPETFFLNGRGRIVGHVIGAISEAQLLEGIEAARTGRPLKPARGGEQRSASGP